VNERTRVGAYPAPPSSVSIRASTPVADAGRGGYGPDGYPTSVGRLDASAPANGAAAVA